MIIEEALEGSRDQSKDSATLAFIAHDEAGEYTEQEVILAVLDEAPMLYSNMFFGVFQPSGINITHTNKFYYIRIFIF